MSDKTIRKGDLVMVVKPTTCCGVSKRIGKIFVAGDRYDGPSRCPHCNNVNVYPSIWRGDIDNYTCAISRLKKIDPPATGEYDGVPVRKPIKQREPA